MNIEWTRQLAQDLEPFGSGGDYINELGPRDSSDHIRASFGANYDRLVALKNQWDPKNVFRYTQNLMPTP